MLRNKFKKVFENLKTEIKNKVHFIGIGGIGMSALALLLKKVGFKVQGSDLKTSYITEKLKVANIDFFDSQNKENIDDEISLIVKTSIIKDDNPEIIAAKEKNIKIITRAELLAKIMAEKKSITVAGTHGKTSTTAIISSILEQANIDPIVINGGIINQYQSNFKLGQGDYLLAESDESDASFVDLPSFIGAITNIEPEHLDFYGGDFSKVLACYEKYVEQIPPEGFCVIAVDDEETKKIYNKLKDKKPNLSSVSLQENSDIKVDIIAKNIVFDNSGSIFDAVFKDKTIKNIKLNAYGYHNVLNALNAIAIADFLKIDEEAIKIALKNYQGVKRRFTKVGEFNKITIIDDYAHHPTEIIATLNSARQFVQDKKIILVLQPHKYSRVQDLFEEFCQSVQKADIIILADIFAVNNHKIAGISQDSLIKRIKEIGHKNVIKLKNEKDLANLIKKNSQAGDLVLCAGAGSITNIANNLEQEIKAIS